MRAHCESKSDVKGQRAGAVRRKQAVANTGPKPSRAATFAKRKKASTGGAQYIGPAINSDVRWNYVK